MSISKGQIIDDEILDGIFGEEEMKVWQEIANKRNFNRRIKADLIQLQNKKNATFMQNFYIFIKNFCNKCIIVPLFFILIFEIGEIVLPINSGTWCLISLLISIFICFLLMRN